MIETEAVREKMLPTKPGASTRGGLDLYPSMRFSRRSAGVFLLTQGLSSPLTPTNKWKGLSFPKVVSTQLVLEYLDDQDKITRALLCTEKDQI